jgi:predicted phage terminase large subunit-like protein
MTLYREKANANKWQRFKAQKQVQDVPVSQITLTEFKHTLYKRYIHTDHLQALDEHLTQVTRYVETGGAEGIGHLIIEMPPRHGKTISTSRLYPIWHLGRNPEHRLMLVSYGQKLADKNSRAARNMIKSPLYSAVYPNVRLAPDSQDVSSWNLDGYEGGADAIGIDAGATGKGAHLLIIDDPIKNRAEAESETYREKVWDGYADDLYSRLEPGGAVIIMMTRWHMDDLIGRLLINEPEKWTRLRLPAIAEKDDPLGRAEGAVLWAARYPLSRLEEIKRTQGEYSFSALYQQKPIPSEGGLFKRAKFNLIDNEPSDIIERVRFWDLALSSKTSADYTVGVQFGKTRSGRIVILDVERFQRDWDDVEPSVAKICLKDGQRIRVGIEDVYFHTQAIKKLLKRSELHHHSIRGYKPDTDKFTRALPFAARAGEGLVDVLKRSWTEGYLDELCSFPLGANNDQVDASSGAYDMLESRQPIEATAQKYA